MLEPESLVDNVPTLVDLCCDTITSTDKIIKLNSELLRQLPEEMPPKILNFIVCSVQKRLLKYSVVLKVRLVRHSRVVTHRFRLHGTVSEALRFLQSRYDRSEDGSPLQDKSSNDPNSPHGLFFSGGRFREAQWLDEDKTLSFYDLNPGDSLDYKVKTGLLRVRFLGPWPTIKTFIVDESDTVRSITRDIVSRAFNSEKIDPDEFSLAIESSFVPPTSSGECFVWLDPLKSIASQGIPNIMGKTLFLRRRLFLTDTPVNDINECTDVLNGFFCTSLDTVVSGTTPCTSVDQAVEFAALQLQIRFGDYPASSSTEFLPSSPPTTPSASTEEFLQNMQWNEIVPSPHAATVASSRRLQNDVVREWTSLRGTTPTKGKRRWVMAAKSLRTYGYTCFHALQGKMIQGTSSPRTVIFGISLSNIVILDSETKGLLEDIPLSGIKTWNVLDDVLTLERVDIGNKVVGEVRKSSSLSLYQDFTCSQAPALCQVMRDYFAAAWAKMNKNCICNDSTSNPTPRPPPLIPKVDIVSRRRFGSFGRSVSFESHASREGITRKNPLYLNPNNTFNNPLFLEQQRTAPPPPIEDSPEPNTKTKAKGRYWSTSRKVKSRLLKAHSTSVLPSLSSSPPVSGRPSQKHACLAEECAIVVQKRALAARSGTKRSRPSRHRPSSSRPSSPANERYLKVIRGLSCLKAQLGSNEANHTRKIRVVFSNRSEQEFDVDPSKTVADLGAELGHKVGIIGDPAEFSLQVDGGLWLNPYQTLEQQEESIGEDARLLFKKKFHYNDAFVISHDKVDFNFLYCECRDKIRQGDYPLSMEEGVQLAATQFQVNFGDHNPDIHSQGFLSSNHLEHFLPSNCLEIWGLSFLKLEKRIYKEHIKLRGIKEEYAKYRYLQLCRKLKMYGTIFFIVKLVQQKVRRRRGNFSNISLLSLGNFYFLGFSRDSISFLTAKNKKLVAEHPLSQLWNWEGDSDSLVLDFGDYPQGKYVFRTPCSETGNGAVVSKYLSDYLDFIQKSLIAVQTFNASKKDPLDLDLCGLLSGPTCWENGQRIFTSAFDLVQ